MCVNKKCNDVYDFFFFFGVRNQLKSLLRVYSNMIDSNSIFHKIFDLCNLDLWFKSYGKSCEVSLGLV